MGICLAICATLLTVPFDIYSADCTMLVLILSNLIFWHEYAVYFVLASRACGLCLFVCYVPILIIPPPPAFDMCDHLYWFFRTILGCVKMTSLIMHTGCGVGELLWPAFCSHP